MSALPVMRSIPPNTQCPSCHRPRLYFLRPNLDSSISSSIPSPPITIGFCSRYWAQTSRIKLYQSTAVGSDICMERVPAFHVMSCVCACVCVCVCVCVCTYVHTSNSFLMFDSVVIVDHMCIRRSIFSKGRLEFSKKVPVLNETTFWHPFLGHRKHSPSGYD